MSDNDLKTIQLARAFAAGSLSLGQLGRTLGKSTAELLELLKQLDIPVLDYDLADELETLDTEQFFAERSQRADKALLHRLLTRQGGELPRTGDEKLSG